MLNTKFKKGFTVVELIVVVAIIGILTVIVLLNYPAARNDLLIQRSAALLVREISGVQEMAFGTQKVGSPAIIPDGYGIHFDSSSNQIFLFSDCDKNYRYNSGSVCNLAFDEKIRDISWETGIGISSITTTNPSGSPTSLDVVFVPPNPTVYFYFNGGSVSGSDATIKIYLLSDPTKTRTIIIKSSGLAQVQ